MNKMEKIKEELPCRTCINVANCVTTFHTYFYANAHPNVLLMKIEEKAKELVLNCDILEEWKKKSVAILLIRYKELDMQIIVYNFFDSLVEDKEYGFVKNMSKKDREKYYSLLDKALSTKNNAPSQ